MPWTYVISDLKGKEMVGTFYKKELQKTNQKVIRVEKAIKRKGDKLNVKWKRCDSSSNSLIDKKDMSEYFPEIKSSVGRVKVELDLFDYAKADLKDAAGADTSQFVNLKPDVDKLNIDRLKNVPSNLNNLKSKVDK